MKAFTDIKEKAHQIAWETSKDYDPLLSKETWCEMAALDMASWLEKQGEQHPHVDVNKMVDEFANTEVKGYGIPSMIEVDAYRKGIEDALERQGENKPTDKVEPKFKIGDYVVGKYISGYISEIRNDCYLLDYQGFSIDKQDNYHLWTINDAKDGDVLVASDGSIFLFAGVVDCACKYYVALATDNHVEINKEAKGGYWETSRAVYPAAKEQRDLLFQKMADAGYEWCSEKKELKKLIKQLE